MVFSKLKFSIMTDAKSGHNEMGVEGYVITGYKVCP